MELYDSQYLLILAPSLVIVLMFLFFWLFMKETSYDEVLARQKRDLKPVTIRPESRKKSEKKKGKKKETSGSHESDSENRDFDLIEAVVEPPEDEEHTMTAIIPSVSIDGTASLRERKKRDKKQQQPQQSSRAAQEEPNTREMNGSKPVNKKSEPVPVTKQPTPPPDTTASGKKKATQKKQKNGINDQPADIKAESVPASLKTEPAPALQSLDPKPSESANSKKKSSVKKQKPETVDEILLQATPYVPVLDDNLAVPAVEKKKEPIMLIQDVATKPISKKLKNEMDKENLEVKFKDFLPALKSQTLSDEEAANIFAVLREKNPTVVDAYQKTSKGDSALHQLQEREKLLSVLQEDAIMAKEKIKQLTQELVAEKQKGGMVESRWREMHASLEKDMSVLQGKAQGTIQESQAMQIKFQQVREQLESQNNRLQQENGILRDAVNAATSQMENKQSAELSKLRADCGRLMTELSEKNKQLQQEDIQRKSMEVTFKQLESKFQESERRCEEFQGYFLKMNAEHEKLQASKQELQNQLLTVESEIGNKNKEVQTLRSNLTEMLLTKEQLENSILQHLEASQHNRADDTLQSQVQDLLKENQSLKAQVEKLQAQITSQASTASIVDELQKIVAEKECQRKALEDALNAEQSSNATHGSEIQKVHIENKTLNAEIQKLLTKISEQAAALQSLEQIQKSVQEKEEKVKTVESLLEVGLIQVATKEDELKALRKENDTLQQEVKSLQLQQTEQTSSSLLVEELQRTILEKDGKLKSVEEMLKAELEKVSSNEKVIKVIARTQLQEVQTLMQAEAEKVQVLKQMAEEREREVATLDMQLKTIQQEKLQLQTQLKDEQERASVLFETIQEEKLHFDTRLQEEKQRDLQQIEAIRQEKLQLESRLEEEQQRVLKQTEAMQQEMLKLRTQLEEEHYKTLQHVQSKLNTSAPNEDFLATLAEQEEKVTDLENKLAAMRDTVEMYRKKNNELREKNWSAMEALSSTESVLQGKLNKTVKEYQKTLSSIEAHMRDVFHKLLPTLPLRKQSNHSQLLQEFEEAARDVLFSNAENTKAKLLEEELKESEESYRVLQNECDTYKKVLAETEGILQRLQNSVEQEECRWRGKLEAAVSELGQVHMKSEDLQKQVKRLNDEHKELENLRQERQHLETDLEMARQESATYISEVRELKDLLTELQSKLDGSYCEAVRQNEELNLLKLQLNEKLAQLEDEERERKKVAVDLYKAQQSLDLIQAEILRETMEEGLIENNSVTTEKVEMDQKESLPTSLNQTVRELQQLLHGVNLQLSKHQRDEDKLTVEM
ncbi:kinectin isoform X2 [Polypterus senegalus]|uniref:kinectin isoform X2 n=1 Tax=Polypterus senegalus TaxID=55291 RepID=UPI00196437F8|nr:kinectin isoform X2 [Polypterus senegalus]